PQLHLLQIDRPVVHGHDGSTQRQTLESATPMLSRARFLALLVAGLLGGCLNRDDEDLRRAAMRGELEYMRRLLDGGANPDYVRGGWSILMRVARDGRADVAEILIANGAKPNFKGKDGASALTIAAEHGNLP